MQTEKSAGAIVYRITEDGNLLYLLLQAAPGKPFGYPKGKIDQGETEEVAARREIAEEAGLDPVDLAPSFRHVVHYTYRRGRTQVRKEVVYFLARTHTDQIRLSWEHTAFRWADFTQGLELVAYENARDTLRRAHAYLVQQYGINERA